VFLYVSESLISFDGINDCLFHWRRMRIKTKRAEKEKFCLGIDLLVWTSRSRKDGLNKGAS